jgi:LysM repeat protein
MSDGFHIRSGSKRPETLDVSGFAITAFSLAMVFGAALLTDLDASIIPAKSIDLRATSMPSPSPFLPTLTPTPAHVVSTVPPSASLLTTAPSLAPIPVQPSEPPREAPCPIPAGWTRYVVVPGDTIAGLASRTGLSSPAVLQANCLTSASIRAGQELFLPSHGTQVHTPTSIPCGPPPGWKVYMVQSGDTLYSLSRRCGASIEAIQHANCMQTSAVYTGYALYLPFLPVLPSRPPLVTELPTAMPTAKPTSTAEPTPTPSVSATGEPATVTPSSTSTPTEEPPDKATATRTPEPATADTATPTSTSTVTPSSSDTPSPTPTEIA